MLWKKYVGVSQQFLLAAYDNDYLHPWLRAAIDPRNSLNAHQYKYEGPPGTWRNTLEEAKADAIANGVLSYQLDKIVAWSYDTDYRTHASPAYSVDPGEREVLVLHFNRNDLTLSYSQWTNQFDPPNAPDCVAHGVWEDVGALWAAGESAYGIWTLNYHEDRSRANTVKTNVAVEPLVTPLNQWTGMCAYPSSTNTPGLTISECAGNGSPPANHVFVSNPPGNDIGYWKIVADYVPWPNPANEYFDGGDWVRDIVTYYFDPDIFINVRRVPACAVSYADTPPASYKVLQIYTVAGGVVTKYPLGPAVVSGSADDTSAFWTSAYNIAVANSRMAGGLTYGVDYPVAQSIVCQHLVTRY